MARATELLARLNPTTCRLDIGRGGVPELTNIDIAGALGMVKDRLGRALLELLYWDSAAQAHAIRWSESCIRRSSNASASNGRRWSMPSCGS